MGCFCSDEFGEVSLQFLIEIYKLIPTENPNSFRFEFVNKESYEKDSTDTLIQILKKKSNPEISSIFSKKKISEHCLFYCFLRRDPVIKSYSKMKEFRPIKFGQLTKIIILLTNESVKKGINNSIIKEATRNITSLLDKEIDLTQLKQKEENAQNPNITQDSLSLTESEHDYSDEEEEEDNEPKENEFFIEGVLTNQTLKYCKEQLFGAEEGSVAKGGTKETGTTFGIEINANKKNTESGEEELEEVEIEEDNKQTGRASNEKINKVVIRGSKFPNLELFFNLIELLKKYDKLRKFGFNDNFIDSDFPGWVTISELISDNSNLRWLDFRSSTLYDYQLQLLTKALKDKRIRYLDLSENFLSYQGMEILSKWLKKNKTIQRLYLQRNAVCQFKAQGVKYVVDGLKTNPNIQIVDFSFMDLTSCGVYLGELILNNASSLKTLNIHCAKLNLVDFKEICKAIKNEKCKLKTLDIGMNDMGSDKSLEELGSMIKVNKTITEINLDQMNINMDNYHIIFEALDQNKTITHFYFSYNGDLKPKIAINYFLKRNELKFLEFVPYNPETHKDKYLNLEEKKLLEKFSETRKDVVIKKK